MSGILKEMRVTFALGFLAILLVLSTELTRVNFVRLHLELIDGAIMLFIVGVVVDRFLAYRRKQHRTEIEAQKLRTLKATMVTVQDIVNNFLNNLMLFQMEAAEVLPQSAIEPLEELIQETSLKIRALGNLKLVREIPFAVGAGIAY